ncbi:hypothetical protein [Alicyclobacillus macrosporangiidus]|uniref:Nucleotidyltransferase/DNA polymerase involved in DNA repair n=1 Tax=Alicyclobacillus macrosporangiidus TaxID=392015 RepID=A0A1I7FNE8_9BACL|nr:hypothetical protein [Alicyclobacillus macrosporangiidus]SFU37713.1 Nucleotidyltransferase/DNA polymerase involved in DNA repair [Alicyclobacillus macrosporangiidus]
MRFTLFGEVEGVLAESTAPLWASVGAGGVSDASLSARRQGVRPGMRPAEAQALVPGLVLCAEADRPTTVMETVWARLWQCSPWLETVGKNAFYLQIPGQKPPIEEVRELLRALDGLLNEHQQLRTALAEHPLLARALLMASRHHKIPGVQSVRVGRQVWVISPGVRAWGAHALGQGAETLKVKEPPVNTAWAGRLPIEALWPLPAATRVALRQLGVECWADLAAVPAAQLKRRFGPDALAWRAWLTPAPGGAIAVNYPPASRRAAWRAPAGEAARGAAVEQVWEHLVRRLSEQLQRDGIGALKVGAVWEAGTEIGRWERPQRRPLHTPESLHAALAPGREAVDRMALAGLSGLEVYASDLRPLEAVQARLDDFMRTGGAERARLRQPGGSAPRRRERMAAVKKVVHQINRKYPAAVRLGVTAGFRERRMQAVLDAAAPTGVSEV